MKQPLGPARCNVSASCSVLCTFIETIIYYKLLVIRTLDLRGILAID